MFWLQERGREIGVEIGRRTGERMGFERRALKKGGGQKSEGER